MKERRRGRQKLLLHSHLTLGNMNSILVLYLIFTTTSAAAFITGSAIRCLNEGEDVRVSFLYNDPSASLMRCKCLNQEVVCRDPSLSKCMHNGKAYKSGETWKNGTCNKCSCSAGDVTCQFETCDPSLRCADDSRLVHQPGDCCPSCVEKDGECTLSGHKPFSLTSFDRKTCSFDGMCNYVMARDCSGKSFSIHLVHEIGANETGETGADGDRIMSVVVKVDKTKVRVSRPQESWRIRVGRQPSVIPFIRLGVLSVLTSKSVVHVRTHLGVKVAWDGRQDLRVSVPSKMKGKVCGLCGNFNSDPDDDQFTRKGRKVDDIDRFISSWKVGKRGICANPATTAAPPATTSSLIPRGRSNECSLNWKKKVAAMTACNKLKANAFTTCHRSVPIAPFYKNCMADVCSCSKSDCHCKSIVSYINQCRDVGLVMSDAMTNLKALTSCDAPPDTSSRNGSHDLLKDKIQGSENRKKVPTNGGSAAEAKKVSCPAGSMFRPCASPCKRTCKKKAAVRVCRKGCRPGCECPPHMVWHESGCIKPSLCPSVPPVRLKEMLH